MVLVTPRIWWWIAVVALTLAPRLAAADKLDDAYSKTDKAWKHYDELRAGYDVLRRKWDQVYKPIDDQWKVVVAAKKAMDIACAGTGHGTQPCTNATTNWAAQVKKREGLEAHAAELDPKHECTSEALTGLNTNLQKAKVEFDTTFEVAKKLFADARAHATSQAERDKIDQKLAAREQKRGDQMSATRSGKADERNPKGSQQPDSSNHSPRPPTLNGNPNWDGR